MPDNPSNREFTARDIIPILALIAFVVVNLFGKWPRLSWILVVVAVFFVILDHYSALKEPFLRWKARWDDRRTVKRALPEFQKFVTRFGQFVNRRTNDNLHYIVQSDLYQGRFELRADYNLPNIEIWESMWIYFSERTARVPKSLTEFRAALMEFHFIIASYSSYCVAPIFDYLPANRRAEIQPEVKAKLNLFQQTFARFVGEYQDFAKSLSESRPALQGLPCFVSIPKPMS
jgi:hypothetical protein